MLAGTLVTVGQIGGGGAGVSAAPVGQGFQLDVGDIRFILRQIQISEAHAAGGELFGPGPNQVNEPRLPFGLRTVDATLNHLLPGQETFGAADEIFPRMTFSDFRAAENAAFDPDGPGPVNAGDATSYTQQAPGNFVFDSHPRTVSNLIVDQTAENPAAVAAAGLFEDPLNPSGPAVDCSVALPPGETCFIPNAAPDVGLSAPFNTLFTFFGQFFDHGLDLVTKGGGTVVIPLQPDDPLYNSVPPSQRFMVLSRAASDANHDAFNTTTPFVDQNQTYTSHPSHQVFLREYENVTSGNGAPRPTGSLIDGDGNSDPLDGGNTGNIGNWAEVKNQARVLLGIELTDHDVTNVPLILTDAYGHFIPGPNGFPQVVFPGNVLQEGVPGTPGPAGTPGISVAGSVKSGHGFLDDIAHKANPFNSQTGAALAADADSDISTFTGPPQPAGTYDDELLNRHFVTGDGRGNENIALTAIHTVFHSEHNRLADEIDGLIHNPAFGLTPAEVAAWEADAAAPPAGSGWTYGERLFQAARFVTEMQYQHLVFEEFARKMVPQINPFIGDGVSFRSDVNPAIPAEFAHAVFRLGHSMLTDTVHRIGAGGDIPLLDAFLNPVEFNDGTSNAAQAAGALLQGAAAQSGNELDEFVTVSLRNELLGLPLDLSVLNLARGRSEGLPRFNEVRASLFESTGRPELAPFESWMDYSFGMRHPESFVNFIAAYGTHTYITTKGYSSADDPSITVAEPAGSLAARRRAADQIVNGTVYGGLDGIAGDAPLTVEDESLDDVNPPADSAAFLFGTDNWLGVETGINDVDLWMGGLAERQSPFGGLLGSTFNYVFEITLENLQNADRFYYLERLDGLNLLVQLEGNSFGELIQRNTTVSGTPADVFSRADITFNLTAISGPGTTILDDPATTDNEAAMPDLVRMPDGTFRYTGPLHVVWNGRDVSDPQAPPNDNDRVRSSEGDDTLRGNSGNDTMEGGDGNDQFIGGDGDDLLTDIFGDDTIKGGAGNDVISSGPGIDLNQGGTGDDYLFAGSDGTETFAGPGDDIVFAGHAENVVFGDTGNDWIEGGEMLDLLQGDQGNQFQNDPTGGHDVISGGGGDDDYDSEGGDDVMIVDSLGTERAEGMLGFDWVTYRGDALPVNADMDIRVLQPPDIDELRDRFDNTEGLSGYNKNDILRGDSRTANELGGPLEHQLTPEGLLRYTGLAALLPAGATSYNGGNIILGGEGSDLIEGKGGDDILDGDRWFNVQLVATTSGGATVRANNMAQLRTQMLNRSINPGNVDIDRFIVTPTAVPADCGAANPVNCDTALFSGAQSEYTFVDNGDGSVTVTHVGGTAADGVDLLWNMEQVQFTDNSVVPPVVLPAVSLASALSNSNAAPVGILDINDPTPRENQLLTATVDFTDADGITGPITIVWQAAAAPGGPWAQVSPNATFTPNDPQVGQVLRAVATYTDDGGTAETVISEVTAVVTNVNDPVTGAATLSDTTPTEGSSVNALTGTIADEDGLGPFTFTWQVNTGGGFTAIGAPNSASFTPQQAQVGFPIRVVVSFVDGHGTAQQRISAGSTVVGDLFIGGATGEGFTGTAGEDQAFGGGGNDNLQMAGGIDIASGDGGDDTINTGPGNDFIQFTGNANGADTLNGAAGTDTVQAMAANTVIGLRSIAGIEAITANGFANVSILGSTLNDTLNFSAVALTNIVFIDGNGGADNITGTGGPDDIRGGNGNDTITGGGGNDSLNGGAQNDTFVFGPGAFGADTITGFDANPTGGQDTLNLTALGLTAGQVTIAAGPVAGSTLITIAGGLGTITLLGVTPGTVTIGADIILA